MGEEEDYDRGWLWVAMGLSVIAVTLLVALLVYSLA